MKTDLPLTLGTARVVYSYEKFLLELGARVRHLRKNRGWTVLQVVSHHGFHLSQWQGFEKGRSISMPSMLRLCEVFDMSLEELVAGCGRADSSENTPKVQPSAPKAKPVLRKDAPASLSQPSTRRGRRPRKPSSK